MQSTNTILNEEEAVVDAFGLLECRLRGGDDRVDDSSQPHREHLGDELGDGVDEAYRPEVAHTHRSVFLWQQGNHGRVQIGEVSPCQPVEMVENCHDIVFDCAPVCSEEGT